MTSRSTPSRQREPRSAHTGGKGSGTQRERPGTPPVPTTAGRAGKTGEAPGTEVPGASPSRTRASAEVAAEVVVVQRDSRTGAGAEDVRRVVAVVVGRDGVGGGP